MSFVEVEVNGEWFSGVEEAFGVEAGNEVAGCGFEIDIGFGSHRFGEVDDGVEGNVFGRVRMFVNVLRTDAKNDVAFGSDAGGALCERAVERDGYGGGHCGLGGVACGGVFDKANGGVCGVFLNTPAEKVHGGAADEAGDE